MTKYLWHFIIFLSASLAIIFLTHLAVLNLNHLPLFENKIVLAYALNYLLAVTIYLSLFFLRSRFKSQLGFLFMAGSFLKFLVFFIFFYGSYKADGSVNTLEFTSFFIPYSICLIIETISLVNLLKNLR